MNQSGHSTGGKVLIAYYSATGSTQRAAEYIAAETDGDLFSIEPVTPYTSADLNWTNASSRVTREYNDESLRNVELKKTTPDNWDEYDTVFIGYPIWWGIAAWPVNNFLKNKSFHLLHLHPSAWDEAGACSLRWPVVATGRRESGSPPVLLALLCSPGSEDWGCNT